MANTPAGERSFPTEAGIFFGLGLGGFFDGIVLHQLLQWHHMLSSWYPVTSIENLRLNTLWDGIFHSATYVFVVIGLFLLWRAAHRRHVYWSSKLLIGTMLIGFGAFNTIEGIVDHHVLGIHHVNETVPREQWLAWDVGFTASGLMMLAGGWFLTRAVARRRTHENGGACDSPDGVRPARSRAHPCDRAGMDCSRRRRLAGPVTVAGSLHGSGGLIIVIAGGRRCGRRMRRVHASPLSRPADITVLN